MMTRVIITTALALGLVACAARPVVKPAVSPRLGVSFTIMRAPATSAVVELDFDGDASGTTTLALSDRYQGFATTAAFTGLEIVDAHGARLPTAKPEHHQLRIVHAPGAHLIVRYRIAATENGKLARAAYLRPVISDKLFFLPSESGLLLPQHLGERPIELALEWHGIDGDWRALGSLGAIGNHLARTVKLDELRHAVFVAGPLRGGDKPLPSNNGTLLFATPMTLRFNAAPVLDVAARIVEYGRAYLAAKAAEPGASKASPVIGASGKTPFLFLLLPLEQARRGAPPIIGRSATDAIVVLAHPDFDASKPDDYRRLRRVIALQTLQQWNGTPVDATPITTWLNDGFQRMMARRLLYRAGLFTVEEYAAELNVALADYFLNPWRNVADDALTPLQLADERTERATTARGELIALLIDLEMRRRTEGRQSLDDVMRDLVIEARRTGQAFSMEMITARLSELVGSNFAGQLRTIAANQANAQLPRDTFFPCLRQTMRLAGPFQLGFDYDRALAQHRVGPVERESAAYNAGLREGMLFDAARIDFDNPGEEVIIRIRNGANVDEIRYVPQGSPRSVPQLAPNDASRCDAL